MSNRLKGKVAAVTGSGLGIGKAIAIAMAQEGAKVVTNNRKPGSMGLLDYSPAFTRTLDTKEKQQAARVVQDAESTAKEIRDMGGEAVPFYGDVSDYEVARNLIKTAVDNFGKIDILVNNAGAFYMQPFWEMELDKWHLVVDSHLQGTYNCSRHAVPLMKEQRWGRIINAISGAWLGQKYGCNYSSAKGGQVSFTRAIAKDLWEFGITVNAFGPSAMTRSLASIISHARRSMAAGLKESSEERLKVTETIPGPETIAPFIVYLATDEAAHISGSVFAVRGGHYALYSEPEEIKSLGKVEDRWTVDQLVKLVPKQLLKDYKTKAST